MNATTTDFSLICRIQQFYYREARLLDERCFQQWFELVDPSLEYSMPTRFVPQPNVRDQGDEVFLSVDRELDRAEGGKGSPLRQDSYMETMIRIARPYNANAWADTPPPRTRRLISNVEVESLAESEYKVYSNFQMFYSHRLDDNHIYSGGRRDLLKEVDGQFRIFKREVITDWDIITVPTLAMIF
jgi:3-phenylpropionate/cinnamic acid dioxygenase small subunit